MRITSLQWVVATAGCLVWFIRPGAVLGQEFQNLGFETSVIETSQSFGMFARVPGWTFSGEELFQSPGDTLFFGLHIGDVPFQRMATDLVEDPRFLGPPPIQAHFSVLMGPAPHQDYVPMFPWMEQTGRVPSGARSIRLAGQLDPLLLRDPSRRGWHLTLGGTEIPLIELPNGVLSGDVTALAGTTVPLRITIDPSYYRDMGFGGKLRTNFLFDAIRFSPLEYTEVPEPAGGLPAMFGLTAYVLGSRACRRATCSSSVADPSASADIQPSTSAKL